MRIAMCVLLFSGVLGAGQASAQFDTGAVGVAWDAAGTVCNANIGAGNDATLYVLAYAQGAFAGGITASEFRVGGFPADWPILSLAPNPQSNLTLGNPLGPGCDIAFPTCQTSPSGMVVLYTIHFLATSNVGPTVLSVAGHTTPGDPRFPCPRLIACDGPIDVWACSAGLSAAIKDPGSCVTAVEQKPWTAVRKLYR